VVRWPGLLGVVVAVPSVTVLRIGLGHLWRTRVLGESWLEASEKMIETTDAPDRFKELQTRRRAAQTRLFDTTEMEPVDEDSATVPLETPGR
jgi:hypothetical protein